MSEQYRYGAALTEVVPAGGAKGVILRSPDGRCLFRIYRQPDDFTDYEIRHDDLSVTIDADEMASFYKIGDDHILDHSPEVLGLRKVKG